LSISSIVHVHGVMFLAAQLPESHGSWWLSSRI